MYGRILVPLDGTQEAEKVLPLVGKVVIPGGEVILLHVLPVFPATTMGDFVQPGAQREEAERERMLSYMRGVLERVGGPPGRRRCEVVVSKSVVDGITDFASREAVDLIAMYTHDRRGLSRLVRGSAAERVRRTVHIEVQVFGPRELGEDIPSTVSAEEESGLRRRIVKEADAFKGMSDKQLDRVAALARRSTVAAGEVLGTGGEPGAHLFVIVQGEAQLSTQSGVGEITVRIAGPGESFPLAALAGAGTLITSAKALTEMELLAIPRSDILTLCSESPEIGMRIYANIADVFVNRYKKTLAHLTAVEERALKDADFLANV
ncbi:MAG: universal stress protein [Chloroflexota bacterium]|nr:universal stress protein [Chloroflexota bacterium]